MLHNSERRAEINELVSGLRLPQKMISPKYFYDEEGSRLFEQICDLPEYYLTRSEISIMQSNMAEIAEAVGPRVSVIEYGIGSGLKTCILLENLQQPVAFIPIDISAEHLAESARVLAGQFPEIEILPVAADFTRTVSIPCPARSPARNLVYFPGSTIGNFGPEAALDLLRVMHEEAGPEGLLLIGADLQKDHEIIEKAYNDQAGITAAFNLNVLSHLNREYGFDFELEAFEHFAVYQQDSGRIEMQLISLREQRVTLGKDVFYLAKGEKIITEHCHKFSLAGFRELAENAGFRHQQTWLDSKNWFSVQLYRR
ncbi:MAG: L-histidine N(alpha)-methyltransferase [Xanthomonadales bacterium]|nr:L-histidine N(alpha)-methyltransferase [Gammaproteobacteria bacterium]NND55892.1 L-histidine N(alpha)-methyltransferase [Xanthomonadales bacterium]NNK50590.1 L-histidine N(alpha)-methyltransferase [Xanthomonadales bacterium]